MGVPTERHVASSQVHIVRFQDGLGIEHWAVRDDLSLMRQLGVLPGQGHQQPGLCDTASRNLRATILG